MAQKMSSFTKPRSMQKDLDHSPLSHISFDSFSLNRCQHPHPLFCLSQDGEPVEFSVVIDDNGRSKAENVTGPMGAFVQGAPRRPRFTNDDGSFGGNDFGGRDSGSH